MKVSAGCSFWMLVFILSIICTLAGTRKKCRWDQRQCTDGSCIRVSNIHHGCPDECSMFMRKCPDTSCVAPFTPCPNNCSSGYKQCRDGKCIRTWRKCPGECERYERECPDGSCTKSYQGHCPGECKHNQKECPDGSCVSQFGLCPGECSANQRTCPDGSCVSYSRERCNGESCPGYRPYACPGSLICYSEKEKCDKTPQCPDRSDEKDCKSGLESWWYYLLIPFFGLIVLCLLCYKCSKTKKEDRRPDDEEDVTQPLPSSVNRLPTGTDTNLRYEVHPGTVGLLSPPETPSAPSALPVADPVAPPSYESVIASDYKAAPSARALPPPYVDALFPGAAGIKRLR